MSKTDTLHGGRTEAVELFGAKPGEMLKEEWFVQQFRVKDYPGLFRISDDEIALCSRACGKPVEVVGNLVPESYERVFKAMREVNEGGFFIYRSRQLEKANDSLQALPAEIVEKLLKSSLPSTSPIGQRPPGSR